MIEVLDDGGGLQAKSFVCAFGSIGVPAASFCFVGVARALQSWP